MREWMKALGRCQRGATAVEYGLVVSLIVIALVAGLSSLGNTNHGAWGNLSNRVGAVEP